MQEAHLLRDEIGNIARDTEIFPTLFATLRQEYIQDLLTAARAARDLSDDAENGNAIRRAFPRG